eukprot:CAMPEP_0197029288 /NCGR_PEP_ID=MMETSP1384-20130603/8770_1 /TAXON_ID=29189 /ORGANISM="Ammonia sp." /LENGTH=89 /DNA_ID=CAMNT_0042458425 /DNA_START=54 /DNA_END=323 /DNA_ORIENTATION=+
MSQAEQTVNDILREIREIKNQNAELQKRIQMIENRLDEGHPLDMARDFTWHEIQNLCIKAVAQGLSFYLAYLVMGVVWERFFKEDKKQG